MGLINFKTKFDMNALRSRLESAKAIIQNNTINSLKTIGDSWFSNSREGKQYENQTGNLLSSTGYIITYNGAILFERFELVLDGNEGLNKGKKYARELAEKYPSGYALICVSGENYAGYVESRGLDVITGSSLQAKQELESQFKKKRK